MEQANGGGTGNFFGGSPICNCPVKKNGRSDRACMSERRVSRRGGQVCESVKTDLASKSRLCIMGTVLITCEMDTGRQPPERDWGKSMPRVMGCV